MSVKTLMLVACLLPAVSAWRCYSDRHCPVGYSCVSHSQKSWWYRECRPIPLPPAPTAPAGKLCEWNSDCEAGEMCQLEMLANQQCGTQRRCVKRSDVGEACGAVQPECKPNVCQDHLACVQGTCVRPVVTCEPWCKPGQPGCPCASNQICRLAQTSVTECSTTVGVCVDRVGLGKSCLQWWAACQEDRCQEDLECNTCGLAEGCEHVADAPLVCGPKEQ